jgi:hypothetical protein
MVCVAAAAVAILAAPRAVAQPSPSEWTITRDLRIDAVEADLTRIGWVAVARDGGIALGQPQDHHVRFFDARGRELGRFGRDGAGPGEFRGLALHGWVGDTLWVGDASTRRTTFISSTRTLVQTRRYPAAIETGDAVDAESSKFTSLVPRGFFADGSIFVLAILLAERPKPSWARAAGEANLLAVRVSADGGLRRVVTGVPSTSGCGVTGKNEGGGNWGVGIPFCARIEWSIAPDGSRIVIAEAVPGATRAVGTYSVTSVSVAGDTVFAKQFRYTLS